MYMPRDHFFSLLAPLCRADIANSAGDGRAARIKLGIFETPGIGAHDLLSARQILSDPAMVAEPAQ